MTRSSRSPTKRSHPYRTPTTPKSVPSVPLQVAFVLATLAAVWAVSYPLAALTVAAAVALGAVVVVAARRAAAGGRTVRVPGAGVEVRVAAVDE